MISRAWHWLQRAIAGRMRQRVTKSGFGFSVTVSLIAAIAFLSGNNLVFLLLACLLALLLLSGFLSRLSLSGLELDLVFPEHVSARRNLLARMKLHNEKRRMSSFSITVAGAPGSAYSSEVHFPVLPPNATVDHLVEVRFSRRGRHRENSFLLKSRFPFGFAERQTTVTLRREVLVYPCLDPQPGFEKLLGTLEGEIQVMSRGRSHDFYRIRPYQHGESARTVDWKATAHTGQLQVREFARNDDPLVELFLDLDSPPGGYAAFERAVDCSAYLCWELSHRGARVRFRTQNFDRNTPAEADVFTVLKYLALAEPLRSRNMMGPGSEESVQIVLSASPEKWASAGWHAARLVGFDTLGPDPGSAATTQPEHRAGS